MLKYVVSALMLIGLNSCVPTPENRTSENPQTSSANTRAHVDRKDSITLFVTGHELGSMKPCGCSGGQLGGFDRRSAVLHSAPRQARIIIDTGSLVAGQAEQDLIKFNTILRAFKLLDYNLVSLSAEDIELAAGLGLLEGLQSSFALISAHQGADKDLPKSFTKTFTLSSGPLRVVVAALDASSASAQQTGQVFSDAEDSETLNVLILSNADAQLAASIAAQMPEADCLICPADADDPQLISEPGARPLIFSVGRFGKYVNRLRVTPRAGNEALDIQYQPVDVNETLKPDVSLINLYKDYQRLVKEQMLLERHSRFPLPDDLEYTGSLSCKGCHQYSYEQWSTKPHATAYSTLEKVGSQYDPECAVCHVVGMNYKSGFLSEQESANLKDVGCENCHGPGSKHVSSLGQEPTSEPKLTCENCHTPEHSAQYAGNKQEYFEKIVHWKEPEPARDVK